MRFRAADTLNSRYWRRRFIGKDLHPSTGAAVIKRLSSELTAYLLREEGRGSHCQVEHLERATGTLFLAYPEDFGTTVLEYEGNELIRRKFGPLLTCSSSTAPTRVIWRSSVREQRRR